jgi:hypothetical protein
LTVDVSSVAAANWIIQSYSFVTFQLFFSLVAFLWTSANLVLRNKTTYKIKELSEISKQ